MSTTARLRGRAALAMIPRLRTDPLSLLVDLSQRHGDRVNLPSFTRHPLFLLSKPDDVAHVLVANQNNYLKAPTYRPLRELLGNGLLTNEGENWARQRKLLQPMFARRHVVSFAPAMVSATTRMLDGWVSRPDGTVVDLAEEMSALTLDVVGRALFSADLTGEAGRLAPALTTVLNAYIAVVRSPLFWLLPNYEKWRTPNRRRAAVAENHLRTVVERIISARQRAAATDRPTDLLDMLLAARDETTGAAMSDQQVRDELMTFMLAGHETTANALAWTFYLLSTHPEARARLEAEVDTILGGRPPTADDEDKLEWTAAVVAESMRLYPPAWILERQAVAEDSWSGLTIPPGAIAITPPYLIHRHPEHWPNPEGFDPTRFLPGTTRHRYAYLPFGGGRRQCIGGGFATLEATLLLATIAQRFRLDLVPGGHPTPQPTVTLRPIGLRMSLHRR